VAAHYNEGLMETVSRNRDIPVVPCMVAIPDRPIGAMVVVIGWNTGRVEVCRTTDTSQPVDKARHLRTGLIELGWKNTMALCGSTSLPNRACRVFWFDLPVMEWVAPDWDTWRQYALHGL
jgi:hypothetical protein